VFVGNLQTFRDSQEIKDENQVLITRFAKPDEIAASVLYLCSSDSHFVVGSELVIDGGMTL
jgi:NAD(P)-dependent dehydrogenase (short-subunit alcohol dehydrogenase family)